MPRRVKAGEGKPIKEREGKPTWLTPFGLEWEKSYPGSLFYFTRHAKPLRALVDAQGAGAVLKAWHAYLDHTPVEHASATRFAETYSRWRQLSGEVAYGPVTTECPRCHAIHFEHESHACPVEQ